MNQALETTTTTAPTVTDRLALAVTGLEPESATTLRKAFEEMFAQAEKWTTSAKLIVVTDVSQKREMKFARESRLALREIRVNAEKARKRLKEDSLRQGKAIDGIANVLKALIEPIEEHLLEQETFAERKEEEERNALRSARSEALLALGGDPSVFSDLGATSESTWTTILENARLANEARLNAAREAEAARVEAERVAEEQREAARVEAARVEAARVEREKAQAEENARLRAEAEQRELAAKAEREKAAAERAEIEAKAKAEREVAEAEARTAREAEAKIAAELEATRKAERDRADVEAKRVADEKAAADAAERAPDVDKLIAYSDAVYAIERPTMATAAGQSAVKRLEELRAAFLRDIAVIVVAVESEAAAQ